MGAHEAFAGRPVTVRADGETTLRRRARDLSDAELDYRLRAVCAPRTLGPAAEAEATPAEKVPAAVASDVVAAVAASLIPDVEDLAAQLSGAVRASIGRELGRCFQLLSVRLREGDLPAAATATPPEAAAEAPEGIKAQRNRRHALEAMAAAGNSKSKAARSLGITRVTLYKWLGEDRRGGGPA